MTGAWPEGRSRAGFGLVGAVEAAGNENEGKIRPHALQQRALHVAGDIGAAVTGKATTTFGSICTHQM